MLLASLLLPVALATEPAVSDAPDSPALHRFAVTAELASWAVVSRASVNVEGRLVSVADGLLHLHAGAGLGAMSFYLGPAKLDLHATLGVSAGRAAHHVMLRGGPDLVSNTVAGDGAWLWPLLQAGYRYQRPGEPLVLGAWVGTTGLSIEVGYAF